MPVFIGEDPTDQQQGSRRSSWLNAFLWLWITVDDETLISLSPSTSNQEFRAIITYTLYDADQNTREETDRIGAHAQLLAEPTIPRRTSSLAALSFSTSSKEISLCHKHSYSMAGDGPIQSVARAAPGRITRRNLLPLPEYQPTTSFTSHRSQTRFASCQVPTHLESAQLSEQHGISMCFGCCLPNLTRTTRGTISHITAEVDDVTVP